MRSFTASFFAGPLDGKAMEVPAAPDGKPVPVMPIEVSPAVQIPREFDSMPERTISVQTFYYIRRVAPNADGVWEYLFITPEES